MSSVDSSGQRPKAGDRLHHLYEIVRTLARFESIEETLPAVISIAHRALALRNAMLVWADADTLPPLVWREEHESPTAAEAALAQTRAVQAELLASQHLDRARSPSLAQEEQLRFIALPLVVSGGPIFASFGLMFRERPDEDDLAFTSALTHHLAIAVDRWVIDSALRRSEARCSGIVSLATDAIISVDHEQRIRHFNPAAERIFGYTMQEAVGASLDLLLPERFRAIHAQHVRGFSKEPAPARRMGDERRAVFGRRKSGEEFPAQASILRLDVMDEPVFTVVLRDITEERRLDEEQRFFAEAGPVLSSTLDYKATLRNIARLAVRSQADICIIDLADEKGQIQRLEVAAGKSIEADLADQLRRYPLPGRVSAFSSKVLETGKPQLTTLPPDFAEQEAQDPEHWRILRELNPREVLAVPLSLRGHSLSVIAFISCQAERRYGVHELQLAENLARRAEVAIDNARLYELAQRATRARDDLLATVSHDLGNPLSVILMSLTLLRNRLGTEEPKQIATIQRSAERMAQLLGDLLDTVRADAGQLFVASQRVTPASLIADALESATPLAESKRLHLESALADSLPAVFADAFRIQQVFDNVLGNAIKFTPEGGRVTVHAESSRDSVRFSVTDSGPGIAQEDLPHLFDRFWQVRRTAHLGTGLGLFIARQIVELHRGELWVESELGVGTTFFFTLPIVGPGDASALH